MEKNKLGKRLLAEMQEHGTLERMEIGSLYRHYKNPEHTYRLLGFNFLEDINEVQVEYVSCYDEGKKHERTLSEWLAYVEWDGQMVPRFEKSTIGIWNTRQNTE